jgi:hypothetical protein
MSSGILNPKKQIPIKHQVLVEMLAPFKGHVYDPG